MKRRVVVTGLVRHLAKLPDRRSLACMLKGESGVHEIRLFDTTAHKVKFGGDVHDWTTGDYVSAKYASALIALRSSHSSLQSTRSKTLGSISPPKIPSAAVSF